MAAVKKYKVVKQKNGKYVVVSPNPRERKVYFDTLKEAKEYTGEANAWLKPRKTKKVEEDKIYAIIKKVLAQKPAAKPKTPPGYKIVNGKLGTYWLDEVKPRKLAANRKAPPGHARDYATHAREVGIDGNEWKIIKVKNGVKRWAPSK
jgi:hypothetical protein